MIKKSFPSLPASFYDVFDDRVRANNFTVQRLKDAVDYVIDNCPYPMPTIANFISYDKAVKYKTYEEMMDLSVPYEMNGGIWKAWLPVRLPNCSIVVWIHKSDIDRYQLYKYQVK